MVSDPAKNVFFPFPLFPSLPAIMLHYFFRNITLLGQNSFHGTRNPQSPPLPLHTINSCFPLLEMFGHYSIKSKEYILVIERTVPLCVFQRYVSHNLFLLWQYTQSTPLQLPDCLTELRWNLQSTNIYSLLGPNKHRWARIFFFFLSHRALDPKNMYD